MLSRISGDAIPLAAILTLIGLALMLFFGIYVAIRNDR